MNTWIFTLVLIWTAIGYVIGYHAQKTESKCPQTHYATLESTQHG